MKPEPTIRIEDARDDLPFQIHWELDDAPLTVDAFRVYAHLVRRHGRNGLICPSYLSIGEKCFRASVGPKANPRSLRNRAMKAMRELVEAGLVRKETRSKKDRQESDSNLYTLTPKRAWLAEMTRRAQVLSEAVKQDPEASADAEGGIPTMPGGIPAMPGGIPTMPKGISTEVLQEKKRGGVQDLEGIPHEGGQPSTPVAEPSNAAHSSSKTPAAETPTHEAGPLATIVGAALASVASVPTAAVLEAPDGVAAVAAGAGLQDSQDLDQPRVGVTEQATSTEQVPAAAGEGAARPGNGAGSPGVDSLRPVDAQVLAARPVMPLEGPAYKALRSLVGKSLPEMLLEKTRTGQLPRGELWLRLELGEIELVRVTAQAEAKATQTSMITLAVRGLDHLIGAVKAPKASTGKPAAAVNREVPVTGPQDLSHLDPQFAPGRRCMAFGDLGVIESATNASYVVLRDDGERVTVDRHVAGHLAKLKASEAPLPEAKRDDVVTLAPVGSSWRPKAGGDVVTVQAVDGINRTLSTGLTLPVYKITTGFEAVPA